MLKNSKDRRKEEEGEEELRKISWKEYVAILKNMRMLLKMSCLSKIKAV
jgi:hypothetical protein